MRLCGAMSCAALCGAPSCAARMEGRQDTVMEPQVTLVQVG